MSLAYRTLHASPLVTVNDVTCTAGCGHGRHEEHCPVATLAFVRSGAFVRRDRMGRHVADATRVVFFDPAEAYMVDHPVPGGDRCTSLAFDDATLREAVRGGRGNRIFDRATMAGTARIHLAHRELLDAIREGDALEVEDVALELLRLCTRPEAAPRADRRTLSLAADAQVLLAAGFDERLTLDGLAARLGTSPFRLCRAFRAATGESLHRHLTHLRLAAALERLPDYRDRLAALAFDVGFSSHSHFTSMFRRWYGVAPRDARPARRSAVAMA